LLHRRIVAGLFANELAGEVSVTLLKRKGGLLLQFCRLLNRSVVQILEAVLLGYGLDGLFAIANYGFLHIASCLIQHNFRILEIVHAAVKHSLYPSKKSL
jgi:hypothetical protein